MVAITLLFGCGEKKGCGSSPHIELMNDMSEDTVKYTAKELKAMREARGGFQIEHQDDATATQQQAADPDAAPTFEGWDNHVTVSLPETKKQITLRIDADVVRWYRDQGKGYQTVMNSVLRYYMEQRTAEQSARD